MFHMKRREYKRACFMDIMKVKVMTFVSNTHFPHSYPQFRQKIV